MNKNNLFLSFILLLFLTLNSDLSLSAQNHNWKVFTAIFDGTPGVVKVDLNLNKKAPIKSQPFMVSSGIKIEKCNDRGLPQEDEFYILESLSNEVEKIMKQSVDYTYAGTFAQNCVRLQYFFVSDTIGIRQSLMELYREKFPNRTLGLNIQYDKDWNTFFKFLGR